MRIVMQESRPDCNEMTPKVKTFSGWLGECWSTLANQAEPSDGFESYPTRRIGLEFLRFS
jgi:hypothetical protein